MTKHPDLCSSRNFEIAFSWLEFVVDWFVIIDCLLNHQTRRLKCRRAFLSFVEIPFHGLLPLSDNQLKSNHFTGSYLESKLRHSTSSEEHAESQESIRGQPA
jgi:hypothetical protein